MIASNLYLWRGLAYNEGGYSVMKSAPSTSGAAFSFSNLHVAKDRLFSEIRVSFSGNWSNLMECEYLRIDYTTDAGTTVRRYGWVDSVEMLADTDAGVASIRWHVDPWTTWYSGLTYYEGLVLRRPSSSTDPPQPHPYRYMEPGSKTTIADGSDLWFVYLNFNEENEAGRVTTSEWAVIPFSLSTRQALVYISGPSGTGGTATETTYGRATIVRGMLPDRMGLDPDDVNYMGVSPVPPGVVSGSGTSSDPWTIDSDGWYVDTYHGSNAVWMGDFSGDASGQEALALHEFSCTVSMQSDDVSTWTICDLEGSPVGTVPWGMRVTDLRYRCVLGIGTAYITLYDGSHSYPEDRAAGLAWTMPMIDTGLIGNSWSSYVYSGSRQADMDQRTLQTQSSLISGLSGAGTTAAFGGMTGKTGAIAGGVSSIMGSFVNYAYQAGYANDQAQSIEDTAHAQQADPMIMSGSGWLMPIFVGGIFAVRMDHDSYSQTQRTNDISYNGVAVQEWKSSCASLISAGGPLQIANLSIGGNAPASAKNYIKSRLAAGVRIE